MAFPIGGSVLFPPCTAKRLKIAKSCFIFGFWTGFTWVFPGKSGFRHTGSVSTLISEPHFGTGLGPIFAGVSGKSLVSRGEEPPKVWFLVFWFLGRSLHGFCSVLRGRSLVCRQHVETKKSGIDCSMGLGEQHAWSREQQL